MLLIRKLAAIIAFLSIFLNPSAVFARQVNVDTAKQVASNFMFAKSRSRFSIASLKTAHIEKEQTESLYYVFNFPLGGWAIISADDVAHPLIAFSTEGSYSEDDSRPVQFDEWMQNIRTDIRDAVARKAAPQAKVSSNWSRLSVASDQFAPPSLDYAILGPLLTSEWDQGTNYNALCPVDAAGPGGHVWAGCVATAMAQVMKYHNYPSVGVGSHTYTSNYGLESADFGSTEYDWAAMQLPKLTSSNMAVATLLYHAGVAVDMDYSSSGSGAYVGDAATALKSYFKYADSVSHISRANYTDLQWRNLLLTEINNSRPVIYRGYGAAGGHAFVCDGYNNDIADDYFHFNWGWSGYYNGYFYLNALTPGSYSFTDDQGAIVGIAPTTDPALEYPYSQGFENSLPNEWLVSGDRVSLSTIQTHSGSQSLLLSTEDGTGRSYNSATLEINIPPEGALLTFWGKRGYSTGASAYNNQQAILKSQFGESVLHSFYNGDYNDAVWQKFSLDLTPWAGSYVKLFIEQDNASTSYKEWTYLDDVTITPNLLPGDIDASGAVDLKDAVIGLQVCSGITPSGTVSAGADKDGDAKIGVAEVIHALKTSAGL